MNTRNYRISEDDEFEFREWDGVDRRGSPDRRHVPPQYVYVDNGYQPQAPQAPQSTPISSEKNIAQTTLTLQQIGGIILVLGSVLMGGVSAWTNLNKELEMQKSSLEQFKSQVVGGIEKDIDEIKKSNNDAKAVTQKALDALDQRIQELDSTVTQLYQKTTR